MSEAGATSWRIRMRLRRQTRELRARALGLRPGVDVEPGAQLGRSCRIVLEPGAHLRIGSGSEVDDGATLAVYRDATLVIGVGGFVGHHCTIAARDSIEIGDGTFLAELVSIRDHDHDPDVGPSRGTSRTDAVSIGRDVWLASKVTVTRGVTIGDRTVVGANAVVTADLPADVVAGGIPARKLRDKVHPEEPA